MSMVSMILALALPLSAPPSAAGTSLLSRLIAERSKITSWEVMIRVEMLRQATVPEFADARWEFHYWRSADGAYRIDRHKVEPRRSEDQDHRDNASFDGAVHRIIDSKDGPFYVREYRSKKPWDPREFVDPRILDVAAQPMEIIHHYGLSYIQRIVGNASDVVTREDSGKRVEIYNHPNGLTYTYHFDERNLPTRMVKLGVDSMSPRGRYELKVDYDSTLKGAKRLPSHIDFTGYQGETEVLKEAIDISWISINQEFPNSLYDWASMDPVVGAGLVIDDEYPEFPARSRLVWNGKSFEDRHEFERPRARKSAPAWNIGTADVVFWASLNVAAVCLCLWGFRFARRVRSESRTPDEGGR